MRRNFGWGFGMAALCGAACGTPAIAPSGRADVVSELTEGLGLAPSERDAVARAAEDAVGAGVALGHVRNGVWVATVAGCRGPCLVAVVDGLGAAFRAGLGADGADLALASMAAGRDADLVVWADQARRGMDTRLASRAVAASTRAAELR